MTQSDFERYIMQLPDVQREDAFGYELFFVGDDHLLPFVSIATRDQDFDHTSKLDRSGAFRLNIGVRKETFAELIGDPSERPIDDSLVDTFLPHPHYAQYNFISIISPSDANCRRVMELIREAHTIATVKRERQQRAHPPR